MCLWPLGGRVSQALGYGLSILDVHHGEGSRSRVAMIDISPIYISTSTRSRLQSGDIGYSLVVINFIHHG
jgi:hypothetical protein